MVSVMRCKKCGQEFLVDEKKCNCKAGFEMISYSGEELLFIVARALKLNRG